MPISADRSALAVRGLSVAYGSLGAVRDVVDAVHSYGGIVLHDVTNRRHAEKAILAGADGVIAVSAGAGGHAGTISPFALIDELRPVVGDRLLVLAGAISNGAAIAAAIAAGADLAYLGTRFIATKESLAPEDYKSMLVSSSSGDIVYTPKVSGIPANFLAPSLAKAGVDLTALHGDAKLDLGNEAKAWSSVWSAGHGVSGIDEIVPIADLAIQLKADFHNAYKRLAKYIN